eukprot:scaffold180677_cov33-Prasinocladus_malaysianus.AAC.1
MAALRTACIDNMAQSARSAGRNVARSANIAAIPDNSGLRFTIQLNADKNVRPRDKMKSPIRSLKMYVLIVE